MDIIKTYREMAEKEIAKKVAMLFPHDGSLESMIKHLDRIEAIITDLDTALITMTKEYSIKHSLTEKEIDAIYGINSNLLLDFITQAELPFDL